LSIGYKNFIAEVSEIFLRKFENSGILCPFDVSSGKTKKIGWDINAGDKKAQIA
jgi:hypothetical protein